MTYTVLGLLFPSSSFFYMLTNNLLALLLTTPYPYSSNNKTVLILIFHPPIDHVIKSSTDCLNNERAVSTMESSTDFSDLIAAFRSYYYQFVKSVEEAALLPTDSTVLNRLGDRIDEYRSLLIQV